MKRKPNALSDSDRKHLRSIADDPVGNSRHQVRARIVLMADDGASNAEIHRALGVSRTGIRLWQERARVDGCQALFRERPRKPGRCPISDVTKQHVLHRTMTKTPANGLHWTDREMSAITGLSRGTIQSIWREHQIAPHHLRRWRKLEDLVGFYSDASIYGLVFSRRLNSLRLTKGTSLNPYYRSDQEGCKETLGKLTRDIRRIVIATHARAKSVQGKGLREAQFMPYQRFLEEIDRRTSQGLALHTVVGCEHGAEPTTWPDQFALGDRWSIGFSPSLGWFVAALDHLFHQASKSMADGNGFYSALDLLRETRNFVLQGDDRPFKWRRTVNFAF